MSRKEQIVVQAAKLFHKKGFQSTSMREIAAHVNIKASSLYNHIKAKEDLLALIVLELAYEFVNHIQTTDQQNISSIEKLEIIIQHHIQINLHQSDALATLNNDWFNLSTTDKNKFIELRNSYENQLRNIIQRGIDQQEIKAIVPDTIIFSMLSSLRNLHQWYRKQDIDEHKLSLEMADLLIYGFKYQSKD
ncbi:MAG: TetR/AcrR family transcriptional regulator [Psychroflexus sp.]|jgi:AcrR family transcriptional regulator|nr:TetR/AcrR family transcriptional regulator [Psychroflexus sp.]MDR9448030.1 TetR/AcrR family transcriptional regulator [Psychroflexus sp.]